MGQVGLWKYSKAILFTYLGIRIVGALTFGLGEVVAKSIEPPGGMNHWALVAWDSERHNRKDVFFIAQFGNGDPESTCGNSHTRPLNSLFKAKLFYPLRTL